jgi:hypothetical protein
LSGQAPAPEATNSSSPKVKGLSVDSFDVVTGNMAALVPDIETFRIYVPLDEMPFAFLDALITDTQDTSTLKGMHICVQCLLHPALQNIFNNCGLE